MAEPDTAPQRTLEGSHAAGRRARPYSLDRRRLIGWAVVMPLVGGLIVFAVYPFIYLIFLSFSDSNLGTLFRGWVGVEHYTDSIGQAKFTSSLVRSIVFALMTTAVSVVLGVVVALLLDRAVKGGQILRTLILLPLMTPPITVAVMWQLLLMPKGGLAQQLPHGHGALQPAREFPGLAHDGVPLRLPR